jgi:putative transposase
MRMAQSLLSYSSGGTMPRQARILLPGLPLHLVHRGHNKQACFHSDGDYLHYLDWLRKYGELMGVSMHAYVLMTNHIHLLASFEEIKAASDFMKALGQQQSLHVNRKRGRSGTLWDGRFFSCPVPTDRYFMACQRYIELNPLRAGMTTSLEQYCWSSYRANAGLREDSWITPHPLYQNLGKNSASRHSAYRKLFTEDPSLMDVNDLRRATRTNTMPGAPQPKSGRRSKGDV